MKSSIILLGLMIISIPARLSAAIVFENMTNNTGQVHILLDQGQTSSEERGSQITLATGPRAVTKLEFYTRIFGAGAASYDAQIRFYKNDGPENRPGTLLWASGVLHRVIDSGGNTYNSVTVPSVYVPGIFTWTIEVTNRQFNPSPMGPAEYNPPTIGSARFGYWRRFGIQPTDWEFTGTNEPPFSARVTAVPIAGDMNCDGALNSNDIEPFVTAMLDPTQFVADSPDCPLVNGDLDGDSSVTGADIPFFMALLLN